MSQNRSIIEKVFQGYPQQADLLLRMALGIVFIAHGSQKLFGWFGGFGWSGTIGYFSQAMDIPEVLSALVILGEFFGGIAILLGFLTRPAALSLAVIMAGAAIKVSLPNGFFLDLKGTADGVEYVFVLFLISLYFVIKGAGSFSLDNVISRRMAGKSQIATNIRK